MPNKQVFISIFCKSLKGCTDRARLVQTALKHEDLFKIQHDLKKNAHIVIVGESDNDSLVGTLNSLFKTAAVFSEETSLPVSELLEVLNDSNAKNLVIGGVIDKESKTLSLTRGNLESLVVPLSLFVKSGTGLAPNFNKFSIIDHGLTLQFGEYEAAVDSVLYEFDSEYRKKLKSERAQSEKTFGACLRRLRLQKGLLQSDFADINEKVIGRIERGEVAKPQAKTVKRIAEILAVDADDIMSY